MPGPKEVVDSTAAFASVERRVLEVKEDLGKRLEGITEAIERLADGVVRKDVMEEAFLRRDERIKTVADNVAEIKKDIEKQRDSGRQLRIGLMLTAAAALLSLLSRFVPSLY